MVRWDLGSGKIFRIQDPMVKKEPDPVLQHWGWLDKTCTCGVEEQLRFYGICAFLARLIYGVADLDL
jgi:hypothetical protein